MIHMYDTYDMIHMYDTYICCMSRRLLAHVRLNRLLKHQLMKVESPGTGRVPLEDFYQESEDLRVLARKPTTGAKTNGTECFQGGLGGSPPSKI